MEYCLPAEQAIPLATRIFKSIFHYPGFAERFMENLEKIK